MLESMAKILIVNDAELDVEAPHWKAGEGAVDDRGNIVHSSPTPLC